MSGEAEVTVTLEVTMSRTLHDRLARLAAQHEQTIDYYVADLLERTLDEPDEDLAVRYRNHQDG